jgi:ubiquitin carboxyl-terminal hydrolase 9/13
VSATTPANRPEDNKDSPEYKKKAAMQAGPVVAMAASHAKNYGMEDTIFTAMKDIFEAIAANKSRTGVVSPQEFVDILKKSSELFRSPTHQDAHEFLNFLLNTVVENVEDYAKKTPYMNGNGHADSSIVSDAKALASTIPGSIATPPSSLGSSSVVPHSTRTIDRTGWVHELFEGTLTSETKCLTCENVSQRDEAFLDLSIDLENHSSVTSCLRNFSASEMLCERNKFHCDICGGLQEAEKRMKLRKPPKILALHLKRFKYIEQQGRHEKLFHRVVYPFHLRLFNTTDDAEDPDRLYELYAVVVHIGGGPYHGHYVSIVKTPDLGWTLYDDEMVEPVDKSYVQNFFGGKPGLATAYVLFYQQTTMEAVLKEQAQEEAANLKLWAEQAKERAAEVAKANAGLLNGLSMFSHSKDDPAIITPPKTPPEATSVPVDDSSLPQVISSLDLKAKENGTPVKDAKQLERERQQAEKDKKYFERIAAQQDKDRIKAEKHQQEKVEKEKAKADKHDKEAKRAEKERLKAEKEKEKAEKEAIKEKEHRRKEAEKKEKEDTKAAIAASKAAAVEDERRRFKGDTSKENGNGIATTGAAPSPVPQTLNRHFRGSKSISKRVNSGWFGSSKDKEKDKPPAFSVDLPSSTTALKTTPSSQYYPAEGTSTGDLSTAPLMDINANSSTASAVGDSSTASAASTAEDEESTALPPMPSPTALHKSKSIRFGGLGGGLKKKASILTGDSKK